MSNYEQKPGTGAIFRNEKKQADNHPDYRGSIVTPSGEELTLSCLVKEMKGGKKYFSISVQEPYQGGQKSTPVQEKEEDDLPF